MPTVIHPHSLFLLLWLTIPSFVWLPLFYSSQTSFYYRPIFNFNARLFDGWTAVK
jgi:hypothetical protein